MVALMVREDVNKFRRGDLTAKQLADLSEQIGAAKAKLDAVIAGMKRSRILTLHVDGVKKIPNGLVTINHGIENIAVGLTRARGGAE